MRVALNERTVNNGRTFSRKVAHLYLNSQGYNDQAAQSYCLSLPQLHNTVSYFCANPSPSSGVGVGVGDGGGVGDGVGHNTGVGVGGMGVGETVEREDRKSTRLNSSHTVSSYA